MNGRGDLVAGVLCAGFGALWIASALGLPYMGEYAPGSGFLPLWLGVCLLALSLAHILGCLRTRTLSVPIRNLGKVVAVAAGLGVCVALIDRLGFVVAVGAYLLYLLRGVERESWRTSLAMSAGTVAVLFAVFRLWLKVPLPRGPWGF